MNLDTNTITLTISASLLSGLAAGLFSYLRDHKKEVARKYEREQDLLKLDLKDLQIKLYTLEKDLDEWKNKYYSALQELISVKADLEETLIKLAKISHYED